MKKYLLILIIFISCEKESFLIAPDGFYYNNDMNILFENNKCSGAFICNTFDGFFSIDGNNILFSLKQTKIFCNEKYFVSDFNKSFMFDLSAEKLILISDIDTIILNK